MNTEIIVAIISAAAIIIAALIAGIFSLISKGKNKESNNIRLEQKQSGKNNTQVGIQNNYGGSQDER
ncbi:hypothetical protein H7U37_02175 [Pseudoflavonifractor phocaeensis]|uniref:hypothetical protein n=1 Tax=Pseudoflavonifractor phocaeensis TaxID=1870988 RepID=UPI00195EC586|nr:hypothetical protein [Pseudoflavonifractor phocaeensis]MBM6937334.1 hypothetical protein [Pseudoflavonifractor phocaeensis]